MGSDPIIYTIGCNTVMIAHFYDTIAMAENLFGTDIFHQLGCWQVYSNTIVCVQLLIILLVIEKKFKCHINDWTNDVKTRIQQHYFKQSLTFKAILCFSESNGKNAVPFYL